MKRSICAIVMIATATILSSCATTPAMYSVSNSRSYDQSYDRVWEDLVAFFASHSIQIKNIAKDSGVIYAETARFDDSVADCGTPGIMQVMGRRANLNVFVNRSGPKPTVSVNTEFNEFRRFDTNEQTVRCNSKGVLERMILDSVKS
jgi:hypothetical protein